jgi:hypothetical protein
MSDDSQDSSHSRLTGKKPTENQLKHLREDLFYDGPEIQDAFEASQLIQALRDDPRTQARQMFEARIKEGPSWIAWEKWYFVGRKEYERESWLEWWTHTRKLARKAGVYPPPTPPLPTQYKGSQFSTCAEIHAKLGAILGLHMGSEMRLELKIENEQEAKSMKEMINNYRRDLRDLEDECSHILAFIRRTSYEFGDFDVAELSRWNFENVKLGKNISKDQFRVMKNGLISAYSSMRSRIRQIIQSLDEFRQKIKATYG